MFTGDRFDPYLEAIGSAELKRMARRWGAASGQLPKAAAISTIVAGLADPRRVQEAIDRHAAFGRTALALLRAMGGGMDAAALGLAVRAAGARGPAPRQAWRDSPADWLQPLADDALLLSRSHYGPHRVTDGYYSESVDVFGDERLLLPSLRPEPVPLSLEPVPPPAACSLRRPQSVLLDLMSTLQAMADLGGLNLTHQGTFYTNEFRKLVKRLGWPEEELCLDGLAFPAPVHGVVSALARSGLLALRDRALVPAESIAQFSLRPQEEIARAVLRGFIASERWSEAGAESGRWYRYGARNYIRARAALWGGLLALPEAGGGFFSLQALSEALFERVGEWLSLGHAPPRPSTYGLSAAEIREALAKWRSELAEDWRERTPPWLESALRTWLYWLGLVEVGVDRGCVTCFRLTELGSTVLGRQAPAPATATELKGTAGSAWVVQPDFEVTAYLEHAAPRQLAFLEHWAERRKAQHHVVQYQLTRESVYRGLEAGQPIDALLDGLAAGSARQVPQNVAPSCGAGRRCANRSPCTAARGCWSSPARLTVRRPWPAPHSRANRLGSASCCCGPIRRRQRQSRQSGPCRASATISRYQPA
jgi:hypothetical protein